MSAFLLAIKKIIAVLTAIFIPASTAAPAIPQHARVVRVSVFDNVEYIENSDIEIVEDEEGTNPIIEDEDNNENPNQEPEQIADNDAPQEELAPVETWDVSATDDDNVTMAFYATEDTEALLNQLAGRITALFTPMTAYADDRTVEDSDEYTLIQEGDKKVEIIKEDQGFVSRIDNGQDGSDVQEEGYKAGTVVVSGEGNMMDYVYNYFIDTGLFIDAIKASFREVYKIEVEVEYDPSITDVTEIYATMDCINIETREIVPLDDDVCDMLNTMDVFKYSPKSIIIDGGVTNISDYAFFMCTDIISVEIPDSVTRIGSCAFANCSNLKEIKLPENLDYIGNCAFDLCTSLDRIVLPENVRYISVGAFNENVTIVIPNQKVYNAFEEWHFVQNYNIECLY